MLPIFLSGAKRMICLVGPSYTHRIWVRGRGSELRAPPCLRSCARPASRSADPPSGGWCGDPPWWCGQCCAEVFTCVCVMGDRLSRLVLLPIEDPENPTSSATRSRACASPRRKRRENVTAASGSPMPYARIPIDAATAHPDHVPSKQLSTGSSRSTHALAPGDGKRKRGDSANKGGKSRGRRRDTTPAGDRAEPSVDFFFRRFATSG